MINATALIDILESEKETYQTLLELSKKNQSLIASGDIDGLQNAVKGTERVLLKVCDLERERQALVGSTYGTAPSPQRLSSIIGGLDSSSAVRARTLRSEILSLMQQLDATNTTNAELLQKGLGHVKFVLSTLIPDDNPTYSVKANPQKAALRLFDGRA